MPSLFLCFLPSLVGCGVGQPFVRDKRAPVIVAGRGVYVEGAVQTLAGAAADFPKIGLKPRLIVFSQDTCLACAEETQHMLEEVQRRGGLPSRFEIFTLLIGTALEDAQIWRDDFRIPWPVFVAGSEFFLNYCRDGLVPCLVYETPISGVERQHTGVLAPSERDVWTGDWF